MVQGEKYLHSSDRVEKRAVIVRVPHAQLTIGSLSQKKICEGGVEEKKYILRSLLCLHFSLSSPLS